MLTQHPPPQSILKKQKQAACRCLPTPFPSCPRLNYVPVILTEKSPVIKCGYHPAILLPCLNIRDKRGSVLSSPFLESVNGTLNSEQSNMKNWKEASGLPWCHYPNTQNLSITHNISLFFFFWVTIHWKFGHVNHSPYGTQFNLHSSPLHPGGWLCWGLNTGGHIW